MIYLYTLPFFIQLVVEYGKRVKKSVWVQESTENL